MHKQAVGIVGPIRAGKDTAGEYLANILKIPVLQISSTIKMICAERNLETTRDNLIKLGNELAREHGDGFLAEYLVANSPKKFVITGMRQLGQIQFLQENTDFILIAVDAKPEIRFVRAQDKLKQGEAVTIEEFIKKEQAENSPPNKQRLFECMKLADHTIKNEKSLDDLYSQLDKIINKLSFDT